MPIIVALVGLVMIFGVFVLIRGLPALDSVVAARWIGRLLIIPAASALLLFAVDTFLHRTMPEVSTNADGVGIFLTTTLATCVVGALIVYVVASRTR